MPNARDHSLLTVLGAISLGLSLSMYVGARLAMIGIAAAILGDLFLSPDLDHGSGSRAYRLWGPVRYFWWPYMRVLPHRSAVSHWPVIGTAGRLFYLAIPVFIVGAVLGLDLDTVLTAHANDLVAVLIGLELSNDLHFAADKLG
jgi:uncharacterized metal-binding protein